MKLEYEQPTGSRTAVQPANACGRRSASAGASRALHELVSVDVRPERECRGGARNALGRGDLAVAGELVVRRECRAGVLILWLSGDLDQATSALLERELDGARADRRTRLLVDLSGLEYIDSSVVDTLVQAHRRARENGDQLSFTNGPRIVGPPPQLTDSVQLRSRSTPDSRAANDEPYYFALAMACADADHQPHLGDRPWGTLNRSPDQAAGASGAAPLPSAARPAPSSDRALGNHNTGIPHGDAKQGPSTMMCYVCAVEGTENPALGICGLCARHIGENARRRGPGGVHADGCLHRLGYDQDPPRITRLMPIDASNDRAPAA